MPKKLLPLLLLLAVLSHSLTPQTVYILIYVLFDKITSLFMVSIRFRVLEPFLASHTGMWLTLWHLVCSLYRSLLFSLVGPFDHHYIFSIGLLCCNRKSSSSITSAQSNMRCMIIDHTHTCTTHKLSLYLSLYLHTVCVCSQLTNWRQWSDSFTHSHILSGMTANVDFGKTERQKHVR